MKRLLATVCFATPLLVATPALSFYNSSTGRWLSRDPIEEPASVNLYTFVANKPLAEVDLLGMVIVCGCIDDYLKELGISTEKYDKSGNSYSARAGLRDDLFDGTYQTEIVWRMLVTRAAFNVKDLDVNQLRIHVRARLTIANNAAASRMSWRVGDHTRDSLNPLGPNRDKILHNPAGPLAFLAKDLTGFFEAINNPGTFLRCKNATRYVFESGNLNNGTGVRPNDRIFIPGDWPYLENLAHRGKPEDWSPGLEGENLIHVWGHVFWGHPSGTATEFDWKKTIRQWESKAGQPGIPEWGNHENRGDPIIRYPGIGLNLRTWER